MKLTLYSMCAPCLKTGVTVKRQLVLVLYGKDGGIGLIIWVQRINQGHLRLDDSSLSITCKKISKTSLSIFLIQRIFVLLYHLTALLNTRVNELISADRQRLLNTFASYEPFSCGAHTHLRRWRRWASSGPACPGLPASQRIPPCGPNWKRQGASDA